MTTSFESTVYKLCKQVPRGRITTYGEIARAIGSKSYRAVGNALNKNPFSPEVPCHRVVRSDGYVGGFARGSGKKKQMLEKEGIQIDEMQIKNYKEKMHRFSRQSVHRRHR